MGGLIRKRHDQNIRAIHSEFVNRNPAWSVELEAGPTVNVIHRKPDLVVTHFASKAVMVMDHTSEAKTGEIYLKLSGNIICGTKPTTGRELTLLW